MSKSSVTITASSLTTLLPMLRKATDLQDDLSKSIGPGQEFFSSRVTCSALYATEGQLSRPA